MDMKKVYKGILLPKHSGKKVTCRIRGNYISNALLVENKGAWYILQNKEKGATFTGYKKYGYKCSYEISGGGYKGEIAYPDLNLIFLNEEKIYELWL